MIKRKNIKKAKGIGKSKMFGLPIKTIQRICATPLEQPQERPPKFPNKSILDVCLEGAKKLDKDKEMMKTFRNVLGTFNK